MYIFTLMSMQFFAGELKFDAEDRPDPLGESPRYNFDTFLQAFLSIFIILTGEGWNEIMYDTMRSVGDQAALFFISVIVLGNMIMIQLLVAIVITNFDESHKITSKRKIIDSIEDKIELGMTINEAMHMVIGSVFSVDQHDEEGDGKLNVRLGKQKVTITRKNTIANSEPLSSLRKIRSDTYKVFDNNLNDMKSQPGSFKKTVECRNLESKQDLMKVISPRSDNKGKEFNSIGGLSENELDVNNKEGSLPPDIADDMSIHLNFELISDKLDVINPSGITRTITKVTNKNLQNAIEDPIEEESEEEKCQVERRFKEKEQSKAPLRRNSLSKQYEDNIDPFDSISLSYSDSTDVEPSFMTRVLKYMNKSSMFLIPDDSKFRQTLLTIVTTPEDIVIFSKAEQNPERYGITDITRSQTMSRIHINEGKILTLKNNKIYAKIFEYFIVTIILLSCIMLCIDTPLNDPDTKFSKTLAVFDVIFSVIFLIEAILKIMAFGFFWNNYPGVSSYIFNWWNFLDFSVVVLSFVDVYFSYMVGGSNNQENLSSFKALRAIRGLRPLRMISRSEGLRIAIQALFASIPAMANVLIICVLFLLIFAILGVNFFKGAYYT